MVGRKVIWQSCDWPNENIVSVPVKPVKTLKIWSFFIGILLALRLRPKRGKMNVLNMKTPVAPVDTSNPVHS
jgi:hypothetical protein